MLIIHLLYLEKRPKVYLNKIINESFTPSKELIEANLETCIRIPMLNIEKARSLNLSNSVAIVVYEALRQLDYPGMR